MALLAMLVGGALTWCYSALFYAGPLGNLYNEAKRRAGLFWSTAEPKASKSKSELSKMQTDTIRSHISTIVINMIMVLFFRSYLFPKLRLSTVTGVVPVLLALDLLLLATILPYYAFQHGVPWKDKLLFFLIDNSHFVGLIIITGITAVLL